MSKRTLEIRAESWPIRGGFRISRGEKRTAELIVVEISEGGIVGRGECNPYPRYDEGVESVCPQIEQCRSAIAEGLTHIDLQSAMGAGAARNALDCALIDLEAKKKGAPAYELLGLPRPRALKTAFTLSLAEPEAMAEAGEAAAKRGFGLLKLKVAGEGDFARDLARDLDRVRAVRAAAPWARLIVDANEGWSFDELRAFAPALGALGVALIEQPLAADADEILQDFVSPVPLCADESCHTRADLKRLRGRYGYINIKLDKAGGLTEAVALAREAAPLGLGIMVGCMVSTSLSMAPAILLGQLAEYVDLDGPLLLEKDRDPGLVYEADRVHPPLPALWG